MTASHKKILTSAEIARLSSPYLAEGRRQDVWEITHIEVEDKTLVARVRMKSRYTSPTDKGGFHLTILSTLEFLSQLMMIFVHVWAGYGEKTKEGWMLESNLSCKRAIRDPENIEVRMKLTSIRKVGGSILIYTKSQVMDKDGLFEATLKGLLS